MTEPTYTFEEVSAFCQRGPRPRYITGAIRWALIAHFSNEDFIEQEQVKGYVWNEDKTQSNLLIESAHKWETVVTQQRPALMIKRNEVKPRKLGINHGMTTGIDTTGDKQYQGDVKTCAMTGSHTVFCIGQSGAEAEALGQEVLQELLEFGPVIHRDICLAKWEVAGMGGIGKLEESREHFVVPVTVAWAYFNTWMLRPVGPYLHKIVVNTD